LLRNIIGESLREALTGLSTKALHRVIANLSALDRSPIRDFGEDSVL
jgi:hypothetical protein